VETETIAVPESILGDLFKFDKVSMSAVKH